jgi:hypothetical protein
MLRLMTPDRDRNPRPGRAAIGAATDRDEASPARRLLPLLRPGMFLPAVRSTRRWLPRPVEVALDAFAVTFADRMPAPENR